MTFLRRFILWCLPVGFAGGLFLALTWATSLSDLEQARTHLSMGELHDAQSLFSRHLKTPWLAQKAETGLVLTRLLAAQPPELAVSTIDPKLFPINLLARLAFDQGEFKTALHLLGLARDAGLPTVFSVEAAALIEQERSREARPLLPHLTQDPGRLAQRVQRFLDAEERAAPWTLGRGVQLLDRKGRLIGEWQPGGELQLAKGVAPELIPRVVIDLLSSESPASIRLSIDLDLSRMAFTSFGHYRGSIVLMDPQTGEVLAAVSDTRTHRRSQGTPAFEQLREPASISKLITTTAALRRGLNPDAEIGRMRCRGHQRFDGQFLYCPSIAGPLHGLDHAMAVSCNVAFADLGVRVGRQGMLNELHHYGFDRSEMPFSFGQILTPKGDNRQLADLSIGLEATTITTLHAALMAAVIGNKGMMPQPTLIAGEDGRLGLHPRRSHFTPGRRVLEREWVPTILSSMEAVADYGTASSMAPQHFRVAMKTGTASDPRYGFHTNYIGIGPLPEAHFAFAIRLTDQPTSRKVRRAARFVTERFLYRLGHWQKRRGFASNSQLHAALDWKPGFESALHTPPANISVGAVAGR